jgi:hypothetical protein
MNIITVSDPTKDPYEINYCKSYATYSQQEIFDWADLNGFHRDDETRVGYKTIWIQTDIQSDEVTEDYKLTFVFGGEVDLDKYNLIRVYKNERWYGNWNNATGWYVSKYTYGNGVSFVRNLGVDLPGLYKIYKERFTKIEQKFWARKKEVQQQQKLNDISLEDFDGSLFDLAEKYGYTFTAEYSRADPTKKDYKFVKSGVGRIVFSVFTVKTHNIQCWKMWYECDLIKDTYNTYVKDLESIKQLAEGYMIMHKERLTSPDYHSFIQK